MDPAKIKQWERIRDSVINKGSSWPRALWFAAVGDALERALPAEHATLAEDFRRDAEEFLALEKSGRGSLSEEQRLAELKEQIQHLIRRTDEIIRASAASSQARVEDRAPAAEAKKGTAPKRPPERKAPEPRWRPATVISSAALAVLLFGATLIVAINLYDNRLAAQVEAEVERRLAGLEQTLERTQVELAERMRSVTEQVQYVDAKSAVVSAEVELFSAKMKESIETVMALRETAVADLERRLDERGSAVATMLDRLQERGDALAQGLDRVGEDLAILEQQLPEVGGQLARLNEQIERGRAGFEQASQKMASLAEMAPQLASWAEGERADLAEEIETGRAAMARLDDEIGSLRDRFGSSTTQLQQFNELLEQGLRQASKDQAQLKTAVAELQDTEVAIAELMKRAEAEFQQMQQRVTREMDTMLSQIAERADLAALRGEDVLERAKGEAERQLDTASGEAIQALNALRDRELETLAEQVRATRTELEQTRTSMIASWKQMDSVVADRQNQLLATLDAYAGSMEERVQQFLDALDVMVVQKAEADG